MKAAILRFKADWNHYLHELRHGEIARIFAHCPARAFARGLELGAGDGYLSDLLATYVEDLVVTDFYPDILDLPPRPGRTTRVLDAEQVGDAFAAKSFDLVFSSNLLEHLPDLPRALAGLHEVMTDDGLGIHVMPGAFWKFSQLVGFYPDIVLSRLDRYARGQWPAFLRPLLPRGASTGAVVPQRHNNPKVDDGRQSWVNRFVVPPVHGAVGGHLREWRRFRRSAWRHTFTAAGFDVVAVIPGPAGSGYGFGLDGLRRFCQGRGWVAEHAFVVIKRGATSRRVGFFRGGAASPRREVSR